MSCLLHVTNHCTYYFPLQLDSAYISVRQPPFIAASAMPDQPPHSDNLAARRVVYTHCSDTSQSTSYWVSSCYRSYLPKPNLSRRSSQSAAYPRSHRLEGLSCSPFPILRQQSYLCRVHYIFEWYAYSCTHRCEDCRQVYCVRLKPDHWWHICGHCRDAYALCSAAERYWSRAFEWHRTLAR